MKENDEEVCQTEFDAMSDLKTAVDKLNEMPEPSRTAALNWCKGI